MEIIVLSIHLVVCVCLIGLVLLQRSEGGALGMGGGSGALMSGRGAADALAKMTSVAGGFFLATSLTLTVLSGSGGASTGSSVFDRAPATAPARPAPTPAAPPANDRPADPTEGSVPASTQLASISPGPAEAAAVQPQPTAPAASQATARAAPLTPTSVPASARTTTPPPARPRTTNTTPASTHVAVPPATTTRNTPPQQSATTTQQRQPAATTRTAAQRTGTAPAATQRGAAPNANGSVNGIALTDTNPESVEVGNGLEAVRRQTRAGPDQ